jgi:3-hydroxypropanoate dehydrogenase
MPPASTALGAAALDQLFLEARTYNAFRPEPLDPALLRRVYELARMGPTTANAQPMRLVFVISPEAKARLEPALSAGNRAKTMAAPATAIVAYDSRFWDELPRLFHDPGARSWFAGKPDSDRTALRNGSLQGAYFILAARALGLDCGPMSGFDNAKVDAAFFADGRWRSNFLINLGQGDPAGLFPRNPRLAFDEACRIL